MKPCAGTRPSVYQSSLLSKNRFKKKLTAMLTNWQLYVLLLPGLVYLFVFKYKPMYGLLIAFKKYSILLGFEGSKWVGFENFEKLWTMYGFQDALRNTVQISIGRILLGFPAGPILAVIINEIRCKWFKKTIQTAVVLPHFISWIVVSSICYALFSPSVGAIAEVAKFLNIDPNKVNLLTNTSTFQGYIIGVGIWQTMGWNSIIYLAAIAGIDPQLYEAAMIDGAGRLRRLWHITLPGIRTTIVVMLILRMGFVLDAGFDQIFALSNTMVISVADILDTYVYRIGIEQAKYHYGTAAGLFKSVISLIMVFGVNLIARKLDPDSALF